jgi:hypothetical protein
MGIAAAAEVAAEATAAATKAAIWCFSAMAAATEIPSVAKAGF